MSDSESMNPTARRRGHAPMTRHEALHFNKAWTAQDRAKIERTLDALRVVEVTLAPAGQEFAGWNADGEKVMSGMGGTLWLGMTEVADAVVKKTAEGNDYQVVLLSNATGSARGAARPEEAWPDTCATCFVKHAAKDDCW